MEITDHVLKTFIVPKKMIYRSELYKLTKLATKFEIESFIVKTVNGKIDMVILNTPHPNARPGTGEFCIPHTLRSHELNSNSTSMIVSMLSCFNLDDCYFTPWDEIKYEKQEVTGVWTKNE